MKLLLDTQLLLWAAAGSRRLSKKAIALIDDPANTLLFSAASLWEITVKNSLGRDDLRADPATVRRGLLDNGYVELPVTSLHAVALAALPALHKDPFDRMLVAQAQAEGLVLLTADAALARYPGQIRKV